jgi:hypothetical protein
MKRMLGLVLAVILAGAIAGASQASTANPSPLSGALHVTKECSEHNGQAGDFCTITSSNLRAIPAGSRVFYMEAAGAEGLDSDVVLYTGRGNAALGHVTLSFATLSGPITFRGGSGRFQNFRANALVTFDPETNLWRWDGTYGFGGGRD